MASVGPVTVYFEDGPLKDEVHTRVDAPPIIHMQTAKAPGRSFVGHADIDPPPPDGYIDIQTLAYHRCPCPVREECVSYFLDEDELLDVYRQWVFDCGDPI